MQLTIPAGQFMNLATKALQFSARGRGIDPGLSLVHVQVTAKGIVRMSAHDASAGARVMSRPVSKFEPGSFALVSEQLDRLTSTLSSTGDLHFGPIVASKIRVRHGRMRMELPIRVPDDFPPMPVPPADGWFEVDAVAVSNVIRRCLWSMCKNDSRPMLSGVHLTSDYSESTDGQMVSRLTPGLVGEGQQAVVPGESWHKMNAVVEGNQKLRMCVETNRVWLRSRDWVVYSMLIGGQFPNIDSIIFDVDDDGVHFADGKPTQTRVCWVHANRHDMLAVVKKIVGVSTSQEEKKVGAAVSFHMEDGVLHFVSHYPVEDLSQSIIVDEPVDWAEGSVTADDTSGFAWLRNIGINGQFMRWALSSMSSDVIKVMWAEGECIGKMPMQFHDEAAGIVAAVMPRRI